MNVEFIGLLGENKSRYENVEVNNFSDLVTKLDTLDDTFDFNFRKVMLAGVSLAFYDKDKDKLVPNHDFSGVENLVVIPVYQGFSWLSWIGNLLGSAVRWLLGADEIQAEMQKSVKDLVKEQTALNELGTSTNYQQETSNELGGDNFSTSLSNKYAKGQTVPLVYGKIKVGSITVSKTLQSSIEPSSTQSIDNQLINYLSADSDIKPTTRSQSITDILNSVNVATEKIRETARVTGLLQEKRQELEKLLIHKSTPFTTYFREQIYSQDLLNGQIYNKLKRDITEKNNQYTSVFNELKLENQRIRKYNLLAKDFNSYGDKRAIGANNDQWPEDFKHGQWYTYGVVEETFGRDDQYIYFDTNKAERRLLEIQKMQLGNKVILYGLGGLYGDNSYGFSVNGIAQARKINDVEDWVEYMRNAKPNVDLKSLLIKLGILDKNGVAKEDAVYKP